MAVLSAFYDESYQRDSTGKPHSIGVAGILFDTATARNRFDIRWKQLLKGYGLDYFHMVECAHGTDEFKGWTPEARHAAADEFFEVLEDTISGWAYCAVDRKANAQAVINSVKPTSAALLGSEYAIALLYAVELVAKLSKWKNPRNIVSVYEDGAEHKGTAKALLDIIKHNDALSRRFRLEGQADGKKRCHPALQGADMVAYEATLGYKRSPQSPPEQRRILTRLRSLRHGGLRVDDENAVRHRLMMMSVLFSGAGALTELRRRSGLIAKQKQQKRQGVVV